jgi:hypothetical protein
VHDLHAWLLSGDRVALSAHVVAPDLESWPELLDAFDSSSRIACTSST